MYTFPITFDFKSQRYTAIVQHEKGYNEKYIVTSISPRFNLRSNLYLVVGEQELSYAYDMEKPGIENAIAAAIKTQMKTPKPKRVHS